MYINKFAIFVQWVHSISIPFESEENPDFQRFSTSFSIFVCRFSLYGSRSTTTMNVRKQKKKCNACPNKLKTWLFRWKNAINSAKIWYLSHGNYDSAGDSWNRYNCICSGSEIAYLAIISMQKTMRMKEGKRMIIRKSKFIIYRLEETYFSNVNCISTCLYLQFVLKSYWSTRSDMVDNMFIVHNTILTPGSIFGDSANYVHRSFALSKWKHIVHYGIFSHKPICFDFVMVF